MKKGLLTGVALMAALVAHSEPIMRVEFKDGTFSDFVGDKVQGVSFGLSDSYGSIQGKPCVDLGLSVKWAVYDVGATDETENGSLFVWGMTTPVADGVSQLNWDEYSHSSGKEGSSIPLNKYCTNELWGEVDNLTVLEPADDAATANWGDEWRTPTKEEVEELISACEVSDINDYFTSKTGGVVTSHKKGHEGVSLYFPSSSLSNYYTSSLYENSILAYFFQIARPDVDMTPKGVARNVAAHVRAVSSSKNFQADSVMTVTMKDGERVQYLSKAVDNVFFFESDSVSSGAKSGELDSHDYVDLGLSVLWATCNVGAKSPTDVGGYYAWGETEEEVSDPSYDGASAYSAFQYKFAMGARMDSLSKYSVNDKGVNDGLMTLELVDDAATVNWSKKWRMPTASERAELMENCVCSWTDNYQGSGASGLLVRSKVPGYTNNYIFLPANGYVQYEFYTGVGESGYYWTSSLRESNSSFGEMFYYSSYKKELAAGNLLRNLGVSIRPVADK